METKFAAALNDQGRFANTNIAGFTLIPEGYHTWKGKVASSMEELAEHVNEAVAGLEEFGSPFFKLRIVRIGAPVAAAPEQVDEDVVTPVTVKAALVDANQQLNETIRDISDRRTPSLKLREEAEV